MIVPIIFCPRENEEKDNGKIWHLQFDNLDMQFKTDILQRLNFKFNFKSLSSKDDKNEKMNERMIRIYNSVPYYN